MNHAIESMMPSMRLLIAPLASILMAACTSGPNSKEAPMTTFILVRHAEKVDASRDPDLSAAGHARARALAARLQDLPLTAAYATEFKRTAQTLAPTLEAHALPLTFYPAATPAETFALRLRQSHPQGTVLIAGHSNTVPELVAALCDCDAAPMPDEEFDRLSVVHVDAYGKAQATVERFGAPTALPAQSSKPMATPPSATPGNAAATTVQLAVGASTVLPDGSQLRYAALVNDSRCPPGVQCVWAGDAEIQLEWRPQQGGKPQVISLHTHPRPPATAWVEFGTFQVRLADLTRGIAPKATLEVAARQH